MSDAPREEEIYQALAPGGRYKSGLVNPVAAQQDTTVSIPMRFKGAMGGSAVGNEDYPDHEPRSSVPYKHYKDLEDVDPKLHEAVTHVADEIHIPRTDLASLVYANSDYDPNTRNGMRTGYMGLTPDDARQLDPEGHLDINDPIDNLFMGAMKYKRISNRFGVGTPNAFAAYYSGGDQIHTLLNQDPDEHRRMAPDGTFEFINKVLGRGGPGPGPTAAEREAELMRPQGPPEPPPDDTGMARAAPPAGPSSSYGGDDAVWQRPAPPPVRPPPLTDVPAATAGIERAIGAQRGQPPVPPPPSGERMIPGAVGPNQVDIQRALVDPAYREAIMPTTTGPGAPYAPPPTRLPAEQQPGQVFDVSGARAALAAGSQGLQGSPQEEAVARGVPVEQVMRERAARVPAPPPARDLEGQRAQAYTGPMPAAPAPTPPTPDDTGWQRQSPEEARVASLQPPPPPAPREPTLTGDYGPLAPAPPSPPPPPPAIPDTSGGYAVGGALRQTPSPDSYGGRPLATPDLDQPTTGSGAPPVRPPAPGQAIGTDNMAAQLNQQELARVQGGRPDVVPTAPTAPPAALPDERLPSERLAETQQGIDPAAEYPRRPAAATVATGSGGPTSTTAPSAGGDTGPPANLPAGAPRALAPPGSAPTSTAAPPIDRLKGNGGAMTPASAVRAGAQGTGAVLTHIARNGPRGMSIGEGWDHFQDLLERAMIMKGDINGLQHAQEYVFRMKHKGAMENLMQAIGTMDDPETAVRFLAKSHAFVTDGTAIGFQVLNNQIFGQKYDEQTHDKIGKPFQVTEQGLRQLAMAQSDPKNFFTNLHNERTTNETGRHNRETERHADEQTRSSLQEKQIEFDIRTQDRRAEQAAADKRARELQTERLQEQADQKERDRQAAQDRANAAAHERTMAADERRAAAEQARLEKQHATEQAKADAAAEKDRTQLKIVNEDLADIGPQIKETYKDPAAANKARQMYTGMRTYNPTIDHETAQDYMHGLMTNKYSLHEAEPEPGQKGGEDWVYIRDKAGNELARVPRRVWLPYLPSKTEPSSSTRPPPRAPR